MNLHDYNDLINLAKQQQEPQRLLFVFAKAELPENANEHQRDEFSRGEGGTLVPTICVDRTPDEVDQFSVLMSESEQTGFSWDIVFVAAMDGRAGIRATSEECLQPLKMMMQQIQMGMISNFLAINRKGDVVHLN